MRPDLNFKQLVVSFAAVALLAGCPGNVNPGDGGSGGGGGTGGGTGGGVTGGGTGGGTTGGGTGGGGGGEVDAGYTRSAKGQVRFKGDFRFTIDLAVGLGLQLTDVCNELGQYPCVSVHTVALQGVDPYGKGLFEPLPVTGATTPVVVERMVTASCVKRVSLDLATPASAVVFKNLALTNGKLTNPTGPEVRLAITELAQRAWLRNPTENEISHLLQLNTDIEATGIAEPAKVWMQAACFTAFSGEESVFY
ncbi:MAG: hypothetical protein QM817_25600 [Archangium sp.]